MNLLSLRKKSVPIVEILLGLGYALVTVWLAGAPDFQGNFNTTYYFIPGLLFGCTTILWERLYLKSFRLLPLLPLAVLLYFISSLLALHFTFDSFLLRVLVSFMVGALNALIYTFFAVERLSLSSSPAVWYSLVAGLASVIPYILHVPSLDFWVYTIYGTGMLLSFRYAVIHGRL